jgi:hypothetical protein
MSAFRKMIEMRQGKGGGITQKLNRRRDVRNPEALAAYLGRKRLGRSVFQSRAARAKYGKHPSRNR